VAERSLCMREVAGSIPASSIPDNFCCQKIPSPFLINFADKDTLKLCSLVEHCCYGTYCIRAVQLDRIIFSFSASTSNTCNPTWCLNSTMTRQTSLNGSASRRQSCSAPSMNKQLLSNKKIPIDIRRRLYQSIVVNIALWGSESWALKEVNRSKLEAFHHG
jgi:hypothetical protein